MGRSSFLTLCGWTVLSLLGCSDEHPGSRPTDAGGLSDAPPEDATEIRPQPALPSSDARADGDFGNDAPYPRLLSQTGLFEDIDAETLGPGVQPFVPTYVLWSDGATKRRWVSLPAAPIDTADMDFWEYPAGTKLWKEFSMAGTRVETRMLHKRGRTPFDWVMIAYAWNDEGTDAVAVPLGVEDALGTTHDIPSTDTCLFCHGNVADRVLGFTALQLSDAPSGVTLMELAAEGHLSEPPAAPFSIPGEYPAREALGYLHANCGDCHNRTSEVLTSVDMQLWQMTGSLATVTDTTGYRTTVDQPTPGAIVNRIVPGEPERSMIYVRMTTRGTGQMPPVATETVDLAASELIAAFIESLVPPGGDAGSKTDAGDGGGPRLDGGGDAGPRVDASVQDASAQ